MICKAIGHKYFLAQKTTTELHKISDVNTKEVYLMLVCRRCGKLISHSQVITGNGRK